MNNLKEFSCRDRHLEAARVVTRHKGDDDKDEDGNNQVMTDNIHSKC